MTHHRFAQVDVFSDDPYLGNPVAVVLDADGLSDDRMRRIARWTNLSETTFIVAPTADTADYRIRIFTPGGELPFAGHPTLGTAHAWLENGGVPQRPGVIVQECAAGLVEVRHEPESPAPLSFTAPPTTRTGPLPDDVLTRICTALRIGRGDVVAHQWVVNGPQWAAVQLQDAQAALDLVPDFSTVNDLDIGVFGFRDTTGIEIRAFTPSDGIGEDPVTGSLNASVGQWLFRTGKIRGPYTAFQGTVIHRAGRVRVTPADDGTVRVGGATTTLFRGVAETPDRWLPNP
ncbi:PhzF family phenazine biosynthesis protein [Corynebacterium sp.]|uniref:PhzF family phenazine biosynthesis protein n=1 Tax=Corynebacterium sp. TaxID=1720 RepID=UPI003B3B04A1